MVCYYGYYSNLPRGKRKKEEQDGAISSVIGDDFNSPAKRKGWARLIQKIYEVDPLTCPNYKGSMRILNTTYRDISK